MNNVFNFGIDFTKMKLKEVLKIFCFLFIIYALAGWVYEELVFLIEDHVLVNRGVLFGPWLPIYGFGGFFILMLFYRFKDKKVMIGKLNIRPLIIFLESTLLATVVELISTYIIAFTGGNFKDLWDYSDNFLNFEGRIALIPDLKFGLIAILGIYLIQPILNKFICNKKKFNQIIISIMIILFIIDVIARFFLGNNYVK